MAMTTTPEAVHHFLDGTGLNGPFLADLLSSFLAHERCGFLLYRTAASLTADADLRAHYEEFGAETGDHIRIFEELIANCGGDPGYVSPAARLVEATDTRIHEAVLSVPGGADQVALELAILEAVVLAEAKCHADWSLVQQLTAELPEGEAWDAFQAAVDQVEDQEDEHIRWARSTWEELVLAKATGGGGPLADMTKEALYEQAKSADIPGRSKMNKEELLDAVQSAEANP